MRAETIVAEDDLRDEIGDVDFERRHRVAPEPCAERERRMRIGLARRDDADPEARLLSVDPHAHGDRAEAAAGRERDVEPVHVAGDAARGEVEAAAYTVLEREAMDG